MNKNRSYLLIAAVLTFLFTLSPTQMLAQENLVDRLNKALNLKLPDNYDAEAREFIEKYKICQSKNVIDYSEKFIVEQMKVDLGINKQEQYLFLLSTCFDEITNDFLYYGGDGNDKRYDIYLTVMDNLEAIKKKYGEGLKAYLQQLSADAERRSADAERRSADAERRSADATIKGLHEMIKFYNIYKESPSIVKTEDINEVKELSKKIIQNCKKFDIDYKTFLRKELGDDKKVKELLKLVEIE